MRIAGIDPGASGALVVLEGSTIEIYTFPKVGNKISYDDTVRLLVPVLKTTNFVYIEDVHGIKGSASKATFAFGYTCGVLRACAIMANKPYEMIRPMVWQKGVWTSADYVYKTSAAGKQQNDTKATSLNCAKRLFPMETFTVGNGKVPHDGVVDALLIATYGKKQTR